MLRLKHIVIACALGLLAEPAFAQAPPDQTTAQAVLPANATWTPTGIVVASGARLRITAQGRWAAYPRSTSITAVAGDPSTDANGYADRPAGPGAPIPEANRGALIGRIGDNGAPFVIGAAYGGRAESNGPLLVTMNEAANALGDNQGRLAIDIAMRPPPPPQQEAQDPPPATPAPAEPIPNAPPQSPSPDPTFNTPPPPDPTIVTPPPPSIDDATRWALIGAGMLALALLASMLIRPRRAQGGDRGKDAAAAQISARVLHDGIAGQSLTIRTGRSR